MQGDRKDGHHCDGDELKLIDGPNESGPVLQVYCSVKTQGVFIIYVFEGLLEQNYITLTWFGARRWGKSGWQNTLQSTTIHYISKNKI